MNNEHVTYSARKEYIYCLLPVEYRPFSSQIPKTKISHQTYLLLALALVAYADDKTDRINDHIEELFRGLDAIDDHLDAIEKHQNSPKYAFYARLTSAQSVTKLHAPIAFGNAVTNIGRAYDSKTGKFTVPVSGVYVFFWSILTNADIHTSLVSSAGYLGDTYTGKSTGRTNEASGFVVKHLEAGTEVWVAKRENFGNFLQLFSSFSGYLLNADK